MESVCQIHFKFESEVFNGYLQCVVVMGLPNVEVDSF